MRVMLALLAVATLQLGTAARAEDVPPAAKPPTVSASAPAGAPVAAKKKRATAVDPVVTGALTSVPPAISFRPSIELMNWYEERGGVTFPNGDRIVYCHGFGCEFRTAVPIEEADKAALVAIFAKRQDSAKAEREAIDLAVQWWEKKAAPLLGGKLDIRGSEYWQAHQRGQTDCLDEATNSTTILIYLQRQGLLRYHHVVRPDSRGGFFYAHATAVFREKGGEDWVVDSWMRDSGDPNDVMTHAEWISKW